MTSDLPYKFVVWYNDINFKSDFVGLLSINHWRVIEFEHLTGTLIGNVGPIDVLVFYQQNIMSHCDDINIP